MRALNAVNASSFRAGPCEPQGSCMLGSGNRHPPVQPTYMHCPEATCLLLHQPRRSQQQHGASTACSCMFTDSGWATRNQVRRLRGLMYLGLTHPTPIPAGPPRRSYAKGFAYFGALYSFNECVIEKYRAKHDKVNPALAGCATGAMMAYGGGYRAPSGPGRTTG
jgi:hypothetical protein